MPLTQTQGIEGVRIAALIDQVNWHAINVEAITPTGEIEFTDIHVLDGAWYDEIPVTLPLNTRADGGVIIRNTCSVALMMHLKIWFRDPDGQVRGYKETTPDLYLVGEYSPVGTYYVTLDKPGNWMLCAELHAEVA